MLEENSFKMEDISAIVEQEIEEYINKHSYEYENFSGDWRAEARSDYFNNWPFKFPGMRRFREEKEMNRVIEHAILETGIDLEHVKELGKQYKEAQDAYVVFWEKQCLPSSEKPLAEEAWKKASECRKEFLDLIFPVFLHLRKKGYTAHQLNG